MLVHCVCARGAFNIGRASWHGRRPFFFFSFLFQLATLYASAYFCLFEFWSPHQSHTAQKWDRKNSNLICNNKWCVKMGQPLVVLMFFYLFFSSVVFALALHFSLPLSLNYLQYNTQNIWRCWILHLMRTKCLKATSICSYVGAHCSDIIILFVKKTHTHTQHVTRIERNNELSLHWSKHVRRLVVSMIRWNAWQHFPTAPYVLFQFYLILNTVECVNMFSIGNVRLKL